MRRRRKQRRSTPKPRVLVVTPPDEPKSRAPWLFAIGATLVTVLFSGIVDAAPAKKAPSIAPPPPVAVKKPPHVVPVKAVVKESHAPEPSWGAALPSIAVTNNNTGAKGSFRLYTDHGSLDLDEAKQFMTVVNGADGALNTRLVQLVFRAAYHFNAPAVTIVSGTRKGAHGKHGTGDALDFKLEGVRASELAKYVRTYPHAGVGIYTHPKTQYVHVDVREHSYHWIDASPPGVTWREQLLPDPKQADRDESYNASGDLPETAR